MLFRSRLLQQVGIAPVIDNARAMGIHEELPYDLSLALGSGGVTMMEMLSAYSVFANDGVQTAPYAVASITDDSGHIVYQRDDDVIVSGNRVFDSDLVQKMDEMLEDVVNNGTGRRAKLPFYAAGKTGTSQDFHEIGRAHV